MFPYVLDRKHSINDYLLATEHNKTLVTQNVFSVLKMSHCSVSWALVSEFYRHFCSFAEKGRGLDPYNPPSCVPAWIWAPEGLGGCSHVLSKFFIHW